MSGENKTACEAWVTLATNDIYAVGALVLSTSLARSGTTRKKVILVTKGVSEGMRSQLGSLFDEVVMVDQSDSNDLANLSLLDRPELVVTYTKLEAWNLVQYNKCVFLDADTLVVRNCDELFDREELSAAPDAGWPDCFNSGVFVFKPSVDTFGALKQHALTSGSFDGGDQGLLNTFFSDWNTKDIGRHLSFLYNMCATATYTYLPAYKYYGHDLRIIHFLGASKPWHAKMNEKGEPEPWNAQEGHTHEFLKMWWNLFRGKVLPKLQDAGILPREMDPASVADVTAVRQKQQQQQQQQQQQRQYEHQPAFAAAHAVPAAAQASAPAPQDRREYWEEGQPDFMGRASFDNILRKIDSTMSSPGNR